MPSHYTPPRPWQPMTQPEWDALRPHILWLGAGRPVKDLRARVDGFFWIATSRRPWKDLPEAFGKPDTVSRQFRRLTQRHLWQKLLHLLAEPGASPGLRALEHWICRACQRAMRCAGMSLITAAQRLGFLTALRGPSFLLPDVDLSERYRRITEFFLTRLMKDRNSVPKGVFALCGRLLTFAGGRRRIPRCLWPE